MVLEISTILLKIFFWVFGCVLISLGLPEGVSFWRLLMVMVGAMMIFNVGRVNSK